MSGNNRNNDSGGLGCAVMMIVAVVAMPLVGLYLLAAGKEDAQKILGVALFIVSIIVWIKFGMIGS